MSKVWRALELALFNVRPVEGLRVATFKDEPKCTDQLIEEALKLIRTYDPARFARILMDMPGGLHVSPLAGDYAQFNLTRLSCELNSRCFREVRDPERLAAIIVHEATHARLSKIGIGYHEPVRLRIEAICLRREIAFGRKLPNGEACAREAQQALSSLLVSDYTDSSFALRAARHRVRIMRTLRKKGVPNWSIRMLGLMATAFRRRACASDPQDR
jgi:hypothetical protein